MSNLVIVESPAKANTIKSYLGSGYRVVASKGHVRDLPKSVFGVDVDNGFAAKYINIRGKGDLIAELKKDARAASKVYLATDPDREGEAISWHLAATLGIPVDKSLRVTFNEVTKTAVKAAIKAPRPIDMNLVNSQQTRRILDRIVGYKLSPYLWKKVRSGLSAGRVQSVATKIIVDREEEIRAFIPREYWTIDVDLTDGADKKLTVRYFGNDSGKLELACESDALAVADAVRSGVFTVKSVKSAVRTRQPAPPFTTSTLQQEASRKLGFQSARIMRVAQELYEGVDLGAAGGGVHGIITYMRTDSLRISADAAEAARELIKSKYGDEFYPETPRVFKTKANAQDAHEAIRPADPKLLPETLKKQLTSDQYKLYKLIWDRFIASQSAAALLDTVAIETVCAGHCFRASGSTVRFPGFMTIYDIEDGDGDDKKKLPPLTEGEQLNESGLRPEQHFTEPPPRYTEASLIKFLEEKGIGRPSTYTPIITTIVQRGYVARDGKSLHPTPLGEITTHIMAENFPDIVNYAFTAQMEEKLDGVAAGDATSEEILGGFYASLMADLEHAGETGGDERVAVPDEETDIVCDKCGRRMVIKSGRFGKFAACPGYPECKNTRRLGKDGKPLSEDAVKAEPTDLVCEKCGQPMLLRKGRFGDFYACSAYPTCKTTKQISRPIGVPCPKCGGDIVIRRSKKGKIFYSCDKYPECDYISWDKPAAEKCPDCGQPMYEKKGHDKPVCTNKECPSNG